MLTDGRLFLVHHLHIYFSEHKCLLFIKPYFCASTSSSTKDKLKQQKDQGKFGKEWKSLQKWWFYQKEFKGFNPTECSLVDVSSLSWSCKLSVKEVNKMNTGTRKPVSTRCFALTSSALRCFKLWKKCMSADLHVEFIRHLHLGLLWESINVGKVECQVHCITYFLIIYKVGGI